ncbi:hypothetical protein K469DRAFT_726981 [Zopfia rhizophila CBS 207.26]|uniref:Methyltransferase type 11 domain-containing protein n=1 Tax=Zopfia rhizophila CBS 207.26 TaxID=1314779 RepID=A0A6A6E328_9PEZI|nr:hypothetical protein K469DRAFT_726981 [Zopfia rhizophila CBS 207.26]
MLHFNDQHRPSYPPHAVATLQEAAGVKLIRARDEQFDITTVEPHNDMREQLARKSLRSVTVRDGLSTSIPAENESVDAVFAAQTFHWFANGESVKEIIAAPTPKWESNFRDLTWTCDDGEPRYHHDLWRNVFGDQVKSTPVTAAIVGGNNALFSLPLGEQEVTWTVWLQKEELWKRCETRMAFKDELSTDDVEPNE